MLQPEGVRGSDERRPGAALRAADRRAWQPAVEGLALASAVVLLAHYGVRVFGAVAAQGAWWVLPVALGLGVLVADFGSGIVHWIGDRFFHEDSPIVGPLLIQPFREHHRDPRGITLHGLLELHGNTGLPVVVVLAVVLWRVPEALAHRGQLIVEASLFCFLAAALATNQLHMWAHMEHPPRLARWLQQSRLVLTQSGHARHHAHDFQSHYCITTGWLNPLLDAIGFFPRLERGIRRLRGPLG